MVLRYREVQVRPFVDYSFTDKFHLRASAGMSVGQTFEIRCDDNDEKLVDGDFDNVGYATVNVCYTP